MKRIAALASLCLFCLLPAPCALAESVTLSSAEAGYSITLPDLWTLMEPAALARSAAMMTGGDISGEAKAQLRATLQGASFHAPNYVSMASLVIQHASNASMGITEADLTRVAEPGNPLAEKFRKEIEAALNNADLTISPAANPPDGLAVGMEMETPGRSKFPGPKLYGITQVRFTTDNVIIISASMMAQDILYRKEDVQTLLDSLIINPDKLLKAPGKALTDSVSPDDAKPAQK